MAKAKKTTPKKKTVAPSKKVRILWEQSNLTNVKEAFDTCLYAFTRGTTLLYIGIAHRQEVAKEVNQTIKRLDQKGNGLVVHLGYIQEAFEAVSETLVREVECLLIFRNQPTLNTQCKKSYTGRKPLSVYSQGLPVLKKSSHARINSQMKAIKK
jgi:hypothetical protein